MSAPHLNGEGIFEIICFFQCHWVAPPVCTNKHVAVKDVKYKLVLLFLRQTNTTKAMKSIAPSSVTHKLNPKQILNLFQWYT